LKLFGVIGAVVAVLAFTASGSGGNRTLPGADGVIAFASIRSDGGRELYTMNDRGGGVVKLTAHSPPVNSSTKLAWSPDGTAIGFIGGNHDSVLLADVRTGHVRALPRPIEGASAVQAAPGIAWAPDGRQIVFPLQTKRSPYGTDLWIANKDGSNRRRLTSGPDDDGAPAWSSDGAWIAFQRGGYDQEGRIEIIRPDGRDLRQVGSGEDPAWSPDGTRLVVSGGQDGHTPWHLFIIAVDDSSRRQLTYGVDSGCRDAEDLAPTWAPSATIAFASCGRIATIRPDGTGGRTLVGGAVSMSDPVWSPDRTTIAFVLGGEVEGATVATADAAGTNVRALLRPPPGDDSLPAWSPNGRRLAATLASGKIHVARGVALLRSPFWQKASWSPDGKRFAGNTGEAAQDVYIIDVKSASEHRIYEDEGNGHLNWFASDWSPDGRRIAMTAADEGASIAFYDLRRRRIIRSNSPEGADEASWSPNSRRLAFDIGRGRTAAIYVARSDGSDARRIARDASEPSWSPDGRRLVFVRTMGKANSEIYVMNADGTHQRRLTFNPGPDVEPDWQPLPSR
jgi:Tol biopolymer transport system component